MKMTCMTAAVATFAFLISMAYAGDSPQFRGPNRDGIFNEQGLLNGWPENGPTVVWVAKGIGRGFSSASMVQGKIYVTGMLNADDGYLFELNDKGEIQRKLLFGKETLNKEAPGTRSTPTIDGDLAYFVSGLGVVYCIDLTKGEKKWEVNILEQFGAKNSMWNLAESVLVDGDRVICTPGSGSAVFAALEKMTGKTIWTTKGLSDRTAYCSATIINHNGRRILTSFTGSYVVGADAENGQLLWTYEQKTPWNIHAVTPLYKDGLLYYTGGDGVGGGALELSSDGSSITSKWTDTNLDCIHYGVVLVDGYLYGTGNKSGGKLVCLEMATGKLMWSTREVREGMTVYADGMLYVYEGPKSGIVSLIKAVPTGFERTGKFTVTEGTDQHWAHPTIANGCLYLRHGDALIAYDVKAK
ncbi:MAG TPA: PQQ-binding-like beta-propeller repeat protein [Candidatus Hydrogenedentes bacterium]|nr:PQQ-binding-like beta-propeller repeat protein [Candidatus Hydrogenedentota bacterium]